MLLGIHKPLKIHVSLAALSVDKKSRLLLLCIWKLNLCSLWNFFFLLASFCTSVLFQYSLKPPVEDILRGQVPDTPPLLENYHRLNPHSAPEWYMPIQLGNNASSTLVRDSNSLGLLKSRTTSQKQMFLKAPHKRLLLFWCVLKATIRWDLFGHFCPGTITVKILKKCFDLLI